MAEPRIWCRAETTIDGRLLVCDRYKHDGDHLDGYADVFWPQSADEPEEG